MIDRERVLEWTTWLVKHESVVNTDGEATIAKNLYDELKKWPYFEKHPEHIWLQSTGEPDRTRYNVIALVKAEREVAETTLLIGHTDTVGTEDYGPWRELATNPAELRKQLQGEQQIPELVATQLADEEWMFGRGTLDMKSGVAAHIAILQYFSERINIMKGNLLLVAECDEEDSSHGILSAVPFLNQLSAHMGLNISAAINADFVTARHEGDRNRYIYLGTVGKLLPTFYVTGKETHVGQPFEGFDPNLVLSELTREIDYNPELCDELYGEWTPPPVSLKQTDVKPTYTVQTPLAGFAYYNFLVHSLSPKDVLDKLKTVAITAFARAIQIYEDRYATYCRAIGTDHLPTGLQPRVYTYKEYYDELVNRHGTKVIDELQQKTARWKDSDMDIRLYCCRLVEELHRFDENRSPVCIVFYSSLYSPRIALSKDNPREHRLQIAVRKAVEGVQDKYQHPIVIRQFFPYISDMSFVSLSDDEAGIDAYKANMPAWGNRHYVPFDEIRKLNVPIVNIGPYGFDAHKKWERVELTYSLEIVPKLIVSVIDGLWNSPATSE